MDADRRSAVSSFYGDRRSQDALRAQAGGASSASGRYDAYAQPSPHDADSRVRRDSNATFFSPGGPDGRTPGSAGYNRMSYFDAGREEPVKGAHEDEERAAAGYGYDRGGSPDTKVDVGAPAGGWDVFADFNNAGPKYSSVFAQQQHDYQPIGTPTKAEPYEPATPGPVEMVTVPALGAEWKSSELRGMSKTGRRQAKAEARREKWNDWRHGRVGLCGGWLTRRLLTYVLFALCVVVGVALAVCIPRVPGFAFNSDSPLVNATGDWASAVPTRFLRAPANFSFPAFADLQVNTHSNILPLKFTSIKAEVFDDNTNRLIAHGELQDLTLSAKKFVQLQMPLNFTYAAVNDTDQTWLNWYNGCKNRAASVNNTRPGLDFSLVLELNILGLIGKKHSSTRVLDAACPIELPQNAG